MPCSSVLNKNPNPRLPFRWTINPYRGCEFGCSYCYARYTHEFLEHLDPEQFERKIYVKFQAAAILQEELSPSMLRGRPVAIGTATDPYQPGEKRFEVTRRILDVFARCPGVEVSLTTKSPMVLRDIDLLRRIHATGRLSVNISLITLNQRLARILEGHAPTPRRRLETIRALSSAGIRVSAFVMPILPSITDGPAELRALLRACKAAGAMYAAAQPVRLMGAPWHTFRKTLEAHFPDLVTRYARLRNGEDGAFSAEVTGPIMTLFRRLRSEVGIGPSDATPGTEDRLLGDQPYLPLWQ